jgi:hypothetical protein
VPLARSRGVSGPEGSAHDRCRLLGRKEGNIIQANENEILNEPEMEENVREIDQTHMSQQMQLSCGEKRDSFMEADYECDLPIYEQEALIVSVLLCM